VRSGVKRIGPGVVSIDGAIWRVRASRKVCRCGATRKLVLPGDLVYAPTKTKRSVRSLRIAAEVVEETAEAQARAEAIAIAEERRRRVLAGEREAR
jgi:hypothetical protein